ncbi:hypothetical protein BK664_14975 [Pseudomonas brassicacearum]|uniref:Uncharacterized protein n=1 Tax=Pseudomonas brassicacearum TaxID=930166 RepID=A0A423JLQ0_9PSED|nr:hypothetical protein BK664_14975 [Pseudomonas brassicacearum]
MSVLEHEKRQSVTSAAQWTNGEEKPGSLAGLSLLSPIVRKRCLFIRLWGSPLTRILPVFWTIIAWIFQRIVFVRIVWI